MNRRDFLLRLFEILDEREVRYVVLRNFESVLEEGDSDVDLLALNEVEVFESAAAAANETGHRHVQRAEFVNHSCVYWNGAESFTRIDVDTSLRWRIFPAGDAASLLSRRIRAANFYIPSKPDEIASLKVNIAWGQTCKPKYAARLADLGAATTTPTAERRAIVLRALSPLRWPFLVGNFLADARRSMRRVSKPPGLVFQLVTASVFDESIFREAMAAVFPHMKSASSAEYRRALFKGGLVLSVTRVSDDVALGDSIPPIVPLGAIERNFIAVIRRDGTLNLAHVGSGRMSTADCAQHPERTVARAIFEILAEQECSRSPAQGMSVLLVGLDGAGKTTFARNLCATRSFAAFRYFHWIPNVFARCRFPWPVFRDLPRKRGKTEGTISALFSCLRLLRNLVRAWAFWLFRVQPMVRQGRLVILDRFASNYWLDAESVRWSGPSWLLRMFLHCLPKPDLMLVLDAEPSILAKRKSELSADELATQRERLLSLPKLASRVTRLDASLPPDAVVSAAVNAMKTRQP
jgi:thymidylate kinase